jgi:hypothetical protein
MTTRYNRIIELRNSNQTGEDNGEIASPDAHQNEVMT